jgi:hypothetical protein
MFRRIINEDHMSTSKKLTAAFRNLRRDGYFARQNWMCCQNCGVHAVPEKYENYVFYHCQDADCLKETGQTHLAWSGDGDLIKRRCEDAGLHVVWDGTEATRLLVSERGLQ